MKTPTSTTVSSAALLALLIHSMFGPSAAAEQQRQPLEGDLRTVPELELQLTHDDGLLLQGPQDVVLRFYAESDAPESLLEVRRTVNADDAVLRMILDARHADDGPAPGFFLSPAELFAFHPKPWMSVEVDGNWTSERLQVTLEEDAVRLATPTDGSRRVAASLRFDVDHLGKLKRKAVLSLRRGVIKSDPSVHTDTSGLCTWTLVCGTRRGQMRWSPVGPHCFEDAVPNMPLAIILRGNGFNYYDYDYLQNHLARNGILSASVDVVASGLTTTAHQTAANIAEQFLTSSCFETSFLDRFLTDTPVDFHRTGIVGHSRGGETARYLAFDLLENPEFTVRAVVALAPTQHTSALINGLRTNAYMLLYGTSDPDVVSSSAFTAHDDLSFNEVSTPTALDLDRSMKLLVGGNHTGFTDGLTLDGPQRSATRGYVHAFFRAWLRDDFSFYNDYIRGDSVPGVWNSPVYSQFSSAIARRVIDSFEHGELSPSTLGGSVIAVGMDLAAPFDAGTFAGTSHIGGVLRVQPSFSGAFMAWEIPPGLRDVASYLFLSLRIGRLNSSGPAEVRLSLQNGAEIYWVDLADYGGVPEPETMCLESAVSICQNSAAQGHMRTIRVPFSDLGPHDDVQAVYLEFLSGTVHDDFLIDNLEFADSLFGLP
jgi:pimeloyl-ACP methyl ester carboxylesterase